MIGPRTKPPLEGTTGQQLWRWLVTDRLYHRRVLREIRQEAEANRREFTGFCPIREHTGDGPFVGVCWHATWDGFCSRHGAVDDYRPTLDDRAVRVEDRRHPGT
jgi:hypothetical protein